MRGEGALVTLLVEWVGVGLERGAKRSLILSEIEVGREGSRVVSKESLFRSVTI